MMIAGLTLVSLATVGARIELAAWLGMLVGGVVAASYAYVEEKMQRGVDQARRLVT